LDKQIAIIADTPSVSVTYESDGLLGGLGRVGLIASSQPLLNLFFQYQ